MRLSSLLIGVLIAAAAVIVFGVVVAVIDNNESTQAEAEEQFCDDVGAFTASLGALHDVDKNTSVEEFNKVRGEVRTAYGNMINSAQKLGVARVDELQKADDELRKAIDNISSEATLQQAKDSIKSAVEDMAETVGQTLNDVNCGSNQGGQERSDE